MRAAEEFLKESTDDAENLLQLLREAVTQVAYYRHLLERYELDALTGLPVRNKFHDYTAGIGGRAAGIGVIFFDVNGLKFYNDTKGHKAGDLLLQKASQSILPIVGKNARAFRVGGDEFVVLITDCTENELDGLIEKWRETLARLNAIDDGILCSVAAGTALGAEGDHIGDVLKLADERMYANKAAMKAVRS